MKELTGSRHTVRRVFFIVVVVLAGCNPFVRKTDQKTDGDAKVGPSPEIRMLSEAEAVAAAERFVLANGYTDVPATVSAQELSRESIDDVDPPARLRQRANSLRRRAYAVMRGDAWSEGEGWTVVFQYNPDHYRDDPEASELISDRGRAVVMAPDGRDIRMLHIPISFKAQGLKRL